MLEPLHQPGSPLLAATQVWGLESPAFQLQTSPQSQSWSFVQVAPPPPVVLPPVPLPPLVPPPPPPVVLPPVVPVLQVENGPQPGRHVVPWHIWPS